MLYEANPMSFIVEQAGGVSSTGYERIMDIKPTGLHQRVPVILGSKNEVDRIVRYHKEALKRHAITSRGLMSKPLVAILMGSASDWDVMQQAAKQLQDFGVGYDARVISAHRSPDLLFDYIKDVSGQGVRCFIAGAGGAAHLAGVIAGKTTLPVLGVPMPSKYLQGLGFIVVHRADAQGNPGGDFCDRRSRSSQCRIVRGGDAGIE